MNEPVTKELVIHKIKHNLRRLRTAIKWIIFSILSGLLIGMVGIAFYFGMTWVTDTRTAYPWLIFFLPLGGIVIVLLYHLLHDEKDTGTNLVLSAIHSGDGSIGNSLGRLFRFDEKDKHIMIMCGMSAAFSALFGTPMAAAIFPLEVVSVGIMHYSALVPCVISALVAHGLALHFQIAPPSFAILDIPEFGISSAVTVTILAVLCALVSISLHCSEAIYRKFIKNPYLRAAAGGCIIILLTLLVGNQDYNGTGVNIISKCFDGTVAPEAFLLKITFTALTLGAGFKGGEIVPTFFIGASFGCLFGTLTGFSPTLCAAIGMAAIFCGVTNSPITSLLISFEMFGFAAMPFLLLAIAFSYMLSGYYGLYRSQKIMYSKFKTSYINKQTH